MNEVNEYTRNCQKQFRSIAKGNSEVRASPKNFRLQSISEIVNGVKVKRFRGYTLDGEAHYVFLPSMLKYILKERFDIIHTHSYGYFQTNIAAFAKYLTKKPLVFTPHFHPLWSMAGGGKRKILRTFYDAAFSGFVFNAADIIICHSKHECSLMGLNRSNKTRIIPAGIDFSLFDPIPDGKKFKLSYNVDENTKTVLFSGRLASNKGLHILVDAVPMVLKEFPQTVFIIAGEDMGVKKTICAQAVKLNVQNNILFTDYIADEEMFRSAYGACDVFVLPSEYEAFGIVLLEAMACGKPCVATDVGGVSEIVDEKTGVLVDYGDRDGLARAIIDLLGSERKRKEMGMAGREKVHTKFTWDKTVDMLETIYGSLIL